MCWMNVNKFSQLLKWVRIETQHYQIQMPMLFKNITLLVYKGSISLCTHLLYYFASCVVTIVYMSLAPSISHFLFSRVGATTSSHLSWLVWPIVGAEYFLIFIIEWTQKKGSFLLILLYTKHPLRKGVLFLSLSSNKKPERSVKLDSLCCLLY